MRMPLKKIALLLAALGLTAAACAQKLKGSDTLLPLAQKAAENYSEKNSSAHVSVTGGGSGVGLSSLREGTTDIAMASRRTKFDERVRMQQAGRPVEELTVAFDALAVIVHPSNPVSRLTREQLEGIFRGKIAKLWKPKFSSWVRRDKSKPLISDMVHRLNIILLFSCCRESRQRVFLCFYAVGSPANVFFFVFMLSGVPPTCFSLFLCCRESRQRVFLCFCAVGTPAGMFFSVSLLSGITSLTNIP